MILGFLPLLGCTTGSVPLAPHDDSAPVAGDDSAPLDVVPHDSDTAPRAPTAPGFAAMDCPGSPPAEGKIDCTLSFTDADGALVWEGTAGVGLHGRSSMDFIKPQFAIELRDAEGADAPADLYGLGAESDWILNGMYIDRALFRNRLCWEMYRELTLEREWAPDSMYVELTWQGEYFGVYLLEERVDHASGRVPVPDDDGTGKNFIVRADETGIPSALQYGRWAVVYPAEADQDRAVMDGVAARLLAMEAAIQAADSTTWTQLDLDSAVAFVLMEEFMKNNDAFYLSHHLYTDDAGLVRFVPWDLDLTLGQPNYNDNENPESWLLYRPAIIANLALAPGFHERMLSMWGEWRAGALSDDGIDRQLAANPAFLGDASSRNFVRWPIAEVQWYGYLYTVTSYEEELGRVSTFAHARAEWMDTHLATWPLGT